MQYATECTLCPRRGFLHYRNSEKLLGFRDSKNFLTTCTIEAAISMTKLSQIGRVAAGTAYALSFEIKGADRKAGWEDWRITLRTLAAPFCTRFRRDYRKTWKRQLWRTRMNSRISESRYLVKYTQRMSLSMPKNSPAELSRLVFDLFSSQLPGSQIWSEAAHFC